MRTYITKETREELINMGFSRQAVWKILKQGWYSKPKRKKSLPVWEYLEPEWMYDTIRKISTLNRDRGRNNQLNIQEDLLDYVYKIDFNGIKYPKAYCNTLLRGRVRNYWRKRSSKIVELEKLDARRLL
jgi:hypothetical protein